MRGASEDAIRAPFGGALQACFRRHFRCHLQRHQGALAASLRRCLPRRLRHRLGVVASLVMLQRAGPLQAPLGRHCRRRWGAISRRRWGAISRRREVPSPGAVRCHLRAPLGRVNGATAAPLSVVEAQLRQRR